MARTSPLHWVGVLMILASSILLLITSISAPAVNDIGLLKVTLTNRTRLRHSSVTFGSFGHCVLDVAPVETDQDYCPKHHVGYSPAVVMADIENTHFSEAAQKTVDGLTHSMVLHPIACAFAFIAFLVSCGAGVVGSLMGALIAAIAWIFTLIVMAIDFSIFGVVRNHVNNDGSGSHAFYSHGMWCVLAAMILLFFGMFIVLFTCFSATKEKKRAKTAADTGHDGMNTAPRKKRFYFF